MSCQFESSLSLVAALFIVLALIFFFFLQAWAWLGGGGKASFLSCLFAPTLPISTQRDTGIGDRVIVIFVVCDFA